MSKLRLLLLMTALALILPGAALAQGDKVFVKMQTNMGDIVMELDKAAAPITVDNFVHYVKSGHYDGTIFHRVIGTFMIQGGGLTPDMKEKKPSRPPIRNEANNNLKNVKYAVAMARTGDPHSATAQFFINTVNNVGLDHKAETQADWGYAVFGKVISGQETVDKIAKLKTGRFGQYENVPAKAAIIEKATIIDKP